MGRPKKGTGPTTVDVGGTLEGFPMDGNLDESREAFVERLATCPTSLACMRI